MKSIKMKIGALVILEGATINADGTVIGVVGMDINFNVLEDIVLNTAIFQSGYAFLEDESGLILTHPSLETGTKAAEVLEDPEKRTVSASRKQSFGEW